MLTCPLEADMRQQLSSCLQAYVSSFISHLPLTPKQTTHQPVSKLVNSNVKVRPLPKYNLWFVGRQKHFRCVIPPLDVVSEPDFKYNSTCKHGHPPTIIIGDYKLQNGKEKHFWFVFYTMITYWMAPLTRNSTCQMKSRYS